MDSEKVTSSIPIPNWVKSKLNNKYDLDDSAFSPGTDDNDFFFIAYPKNAKKTNFVPETPEDSNYMSISQAFNNNNNNNDNIPTITAGSGIGYGQHNNISTSTSGSGIGYGQHTLPCQKYLGGMCDTTAVNKKVTKSFGIDDGFKGEAAECGKSIVAVAEEMVRTNQLYTGRASDDTFTTSSGLPNQNYLRTRRNSRSLPTSPLMSRKKNPFFTPPLIGAVDSPSTDNLYTEGSITRKLRDLSPGGGTGAMRAKPTELREINFWSPTSM